MSEIKARDAGDLRKYRTEIPNLVLELGVSPYALALYVHLKRTAGQDGACYKGTRRLAEDTGISVGKISDARKELEEAGLIEVQRFENRRKSAEVTCNDIWLKNFQHFAERSPHEHKNAEVCSPHERERSPHEQRNKPIEEVRDTNVSPRRDNADALPPTGLEKKKKAFNQKQERAREEYEAIVASSKLGRKLSLFVESAAQKRNRGGSLRFTTKLKDYGKPFLEALDSLPADALVFGLDAAVRNKAKTFPYVIAAAEGYDPSVHERFKQNSKPKNRVAIVGATDDDYRLEDYR